MNYSLITPEYNLLGKPPQPNLFQCVSRKAAHLQPLFLAPAEGSSMRSCSFKLSADLYSQKTQGAAALMGKASR
jgi:hypothetical protein